MGELSQQPAQGSESSSVLSCASHRENTPGDSPGCVGLGCGEGLRRDFGIGPAEDLKQQDRKGRASVRGRRGLKGRCVDKEAVQSRHRRVGGGVGPLCEPP